MMGAPLEGCGLAEKGQIRRTPAEDGFASDAGDGYFLVIVFSLFQDEATTSNPPLTTSNSLSTTSNPLSTTSKSPSTTIKKTAENGLFFFKI